MTSTGRPPGSGVAGEVRPPPGAAQDFLDDLDHVAAALCLTATAVGRFDAFYPLRQLRGMAGSPAGRGRLASVDVRVFAAHDYARRWAAHFGWDLAAGRVVGVAEFDLLAGMRSAGVSCRGLAAGVGCDHSFLAKVLARKKPWPPGLFEKAEAYLAAGRRAGLLPGGVFG